MQGRQSLGGWWGEGNFSRGKMFLFNTLSRLSFFREICHWECWKYHFRVSTSQNFLGEEAPEPLPQQTRISRASFQAPPPSWNCALPSLPCNACTICLPSKFCIFKLLDCIKLFPFKNNNLLSLQVPKVNWKMLIFSYIDVHSPLFFCKFVRIEHFTGSHLGFKCDKSTGIRACNHLISTILQKNKGQSNFLLTIIINTQSREKVVRLNYHK